MIEPAAVAVLSEAEEVEQLRLEGDQALEDEVNIQEDFWACLTGAARWEDMFEYSDGEPDF